MGEQLTMTEVMINDVESQLEQRHRNIRFDIHSILTHMANDILQNVILKSSDIKAAEAVQEAVQNFDWEWPIPPATPTPESRQDD